MNKSLLLAAVTCLLGLAVPSWAVSSLAQVWQTEGLAVPESVLYVAHKKEPYLLVSQIDGVPTEVDGKGGIAKMSTQGKILELDWITGLNAPKGMATDGKLLYVSDITELVVIDIKKQKVVKKIQVPEAVFLNDVAVSEAGVVYVSDTRTNRVYAYDGEELRLHLDNATSANGLLALGKNLIVGAGKDLLIYNYKKQPLTLATGFAENIDGIEMVSRGEFLVSCWPGLLYYVAADGRIQLLLDSREQKINTADIGYDSQQRLLFVPNFFKNTVTAYQLN